MHIQAPGGARPNWPRSQFNSNICDQRDIQLAIILDFEQSNATIISVSKLPDMTSTCAMPPTEADNTPKRLT